jgi:hypothetical protein
MWLWCWDGRIMAVNSKPYRRLKHFNIHLLQEDISNLFYDMLSVCYNTMAPWLCCCRSHVNTTLRAPKHFIKNSGSGTGSTQPREYNWGATWKKSSGSCLENRQYSCMDPSRWPCGNFYSQKLAITSPTSGGRSVSIVRSRTQTMELKKLKLKTFHNHCIATPHRMPHVLCFTADNSDIVKRRFLK